jgi:hypothetical protein
MRPTGEDRAVSSVVGFLLVVGIVVLLLAIYQAQIIPAQNRGTEFQHSQTVQNDMVDLRNAILTADTNGERTFASVQLGTTYQPRVIGINPGPPSGSLRTADPQPIVVSSGGDRVTSLCPAGDPIQTRTLTYSPVYSEFTSAPDIVYENTVLYLSFEDRNVVLTGEDLFANDEANLVPLNTSFSRDGTQTVTVEPVPGATNTRSVTDASVTVPTELSENTWEDLLADDVDPSNVAVSDGNLTVSGVGDLEVSCSPTGLNRAPAGGERGDAGGVEVNPAGPDNVELRGVQLLKTGGDPDRLALTLNNTADEATNITQARAPFYYNGQNNKDIQAFDIADEPGQAYATLEIRGPTETLDPQIRISGGGEEIIYLEESSDTDIGKQDFLIIELVFSNGKRGTYFVDVPNS